MPNQRPVEIQRMWFNVPSSSNVFHRFHGQRVLAVTLPNRPDFFEVYFTEGDVVSMQAPRLTLSLGWPKR